MSLEGLEPVELLLVEDSDEDAELAMRALRKSHGAGVLRRLKDGAEALELLLPAKATERRASGRRRVVFLDLKLPKVSGLDVLRRLRGDARTRSIPIVVLTSSAEERDLTECYGLGANSFIVKPVEFQKFIETVEQVGLYWTQLNRSPPA